MLQRTGHHVPDRAMQRATIPFDAGTQTETADVLMLWWEYRYWLTSLTSCYTYIADQLLRSFRCFQKNDWWASCKVSCAPGAVSFGASSWFFLCISHVTLHMFGILFIYIYNVYFPELVERNIYRKTQTIFSSENWLNCGFLQLFPFNPSIDGTIYGWHHHAAQSTHCEALIPMIHQPMLRHGLVR